MATIALSMIVKDGAKTLRACLASVRGVVDAMVIADTGSSDDTVAIAHEFGAMVIHIPWDGSFAKARNAALAATNSDWVLVLDADEQLDPKAGQFLPSLMGNRRWAGYNIPIRNYLPVRYGRINDRRSVANDGRMIPAEVAPSYSVHSYCRMFRRRADIFFQGCVHEMVEPCFKALGLELGDANFPIHHTGFLADSVLRSNKSEFYRDLLRKKVAENPDDARAWIELGYQEYDPFRNYEEALLCYERALVLNPNDSSAWVYTGMLHLDLGHDREALVALELASKTIETAGEREQLRGDALHNLGLLKEAAVAYRTSLKALDGQDPLVESKLGYTEVRLGHRQTGLRKLRNAIAAEPEMPQLRHRLVKAYVALGDLKQAAAEAEEFAERIPMPQAYSLAASLRAQLDDLAGAERLLSCGLELFPGSVELQQVYSSLGNGKLLILDEVPLAPACGV